VKIVGVNPNVAYPRRGKTRQSAPNVGARRLGQDEQYLTVREILSEPSTLADGALSRERSDFYRFGYATLGLTEARAMPPGNKVSFTAPSLPSEGNDTSSPDIA
jgi:hypothetical protein